MDPRKRHWSMGVDASEGVMRQLLLQGQKTRRKCKQFGFFMLKIHCWEGVGTERTHWFTPGIYHYPLAPPLGEPSMKPAGRADG